MKYVISMTTLLAALTLGSGVYAGAAMDGKATTQAEKDAAAALVAAGATLTATVFGAVAGIPMMIADNDDGSKSCWVKVLNSNEISDPEMLAKYKALGLPVHEFLKHADIAVYPPGHPTRYVARNRRGETFAMRQTVNEPDYHRFHMEPMPKMIDYQVDQA